MIETDMLIIGGGIAGASTAYHLAQHGHDVTLLERGEIASEASGVNAGSIGAIGWGDTPDAPSNHRDAKYVPRTPYLSRIRPPSATAETGKSSNVNET